MRRSDAETGQDADLLRRVYQPVCAIKDGVAKTYSNPCFAKADGATVSADGECPKLSVGVSAAQLAAARAAGAEPAPPTHAFGAMRVSPPM